MMSTQSLSTVQGVRSPTKQFERRRWTLETSLVKVSIELLRPIGLVSILQTKSVTVAREMLKSNRCVFHRV